MSSSSHRRRQYRNSGRFGPSHLDQLTDDDLLSMRISDLAVHIQGTPLEDRTNRLLDELERKGLTFRPHFWLSDDWFTPDGVPGFAIPFYLAHPRLMRLEGKQMREVEGGTEDWCMKILRHEAGHAIDNAYRLRRRRQWREIFGPASLPYPEYYRPKPYSKNYVLHLDAWYAQSHPVEDFAETFAVWLKPRSRWRTQYRSWPALRKLEYVDELMSEIGEQKPSVRSREHVDSVRTIKKTLSEHYEAKRKHYGLDHPNVYDEDLRKLFSDDVDYRECQTAVSFLRRNQSEIRRIVSQWSGAYLYAVDQVLVEMIQRCRELRLRVHRPESEVLRDVLMMVTVQTLTYLRDGHHRVAL